MDKLLIAIYIAATVGGLVLLKLGTGVGSPISLADGRLVLNISALALLGIIVYGVSFLLYIVLISKFNLSYIVPLTTGIVYVLIFVTSYFIFKESFTPLKIIAVIMIMGGVVLLNSTPAPQSTSNTPKVSNVK
jgi:drug/metabolite transporter (DMT)-like permease